MHTFTLSGNTSVLAYNFPVLHLKPDSEYELAFVSMETFNSMPNVDKDNNMLYIEGFDPIKIPTGSYEFIDIANYFNEYINDNIDTFTNVSITLKPNLNTQKSQIKCSHKIDFTKPNSIGKLLGYDEVIIEPNTLTESTNTVNIFRVNVLRINCNIVKGAYHNGREVHTIHEFFPRVPPGYKIIETPQNLLYLPINTHTIDYIKIEIHDQEDRLVNFNSEVITIRLHLREVSQNGYKI
jgi:hypothetical protein